MTARNAARIVEHHIVAEGRSSFPLKCAFDPMILSALCAWRGSTRICQDVSLGMTCRFPGSFAFLDWEPRFGGRAELYLIADTPEHGLLPAALIVLGGSIEEGMRAAGDYIGLGAAIGKPQILTQEVEKACAGH